jgi:hypothetical protein
MPLPLILQIPRIHRTKRPRIASRPSNRIRIAQAVLTGPSLPVIQPSFSSMIRLKNFAFTSECVTWMIVVP